MKGVLWELKREGHVLAGIVDGLPCPRGRVGIEVGFDGGLGCFRSWSLGCVVEAGPQCFAWKIEDSRVGPGTVVVGIVDSGLNLTVLTKEFR